MGCSASRPNTLITKNHLPDENHPPNASPCSLENPVFSSQCSSPALPRAFSLQTPLVHHPPSRKGDSHHLVSLTSTSYGSLLLIDQHQSPRKSVKKQDAADPDESLSPDSVINTWELMDGLDDDIDFEMDNLIKPKSSLSYGSVESVSKSSPFQHQNSDGGVKKPHKPLDSAKSEDKPVSSSKPLWKHLSEESFLSNMDPDVVSSYRNALSSRQLGYSKESRNVRSLDSSPMSASFSIKRGFFLHDKEGKIVLYFTSLRGIRKTYEDCCAVKMIFRGFRVPVDERDISMDSSYRKELQSLLKGQAMSLPQVFIGGKHVGGVEDIRLLNDTGELARLLEGFPFRDPRVVCESCGDARFVPCRNCNGSRKVFDEEEEQLKRCRDCNENGLIRCPGCCS